MYTIKTFLADQVRTEEASGAIAPEVFRKWTDNRYRVFFFDGHKEKETPVNAYHELSPLVAAAGNGDFSIHLYNEGFVEPDDYTPYVTRALNEGWIQKKELQLTAASLNETIAGSMLYFTMDILKKPSMIQAIYNRVQKGGTIQIGDIKSPVIVLADMLMAKSRLENYLLALATNDKTIERLTQARATEIIDLLDDKAYVLSRFDNFADKDLFVQCLEHAVISDCKPLIALINDRPIEDVRKLLPSPDALTPLEGRPSDSLLALAQWIYKVDSARICTSFISNALVAGHRLPVFHTAPEVRSKFEYKTILKSFDSIEIPRACKHELADVFYASPAAGLTMATADWNVITGLGRLARLPMFSRHQHETFRQFLDKAKRHHDAVKWSIYGLGFTVEISGKRVNVIPIESEQNISPVTTAVLELIRQKRGIDGNDRLSFGTKVKIIEKTSGKEQTGFVRGFSHQGWVKLAVTAEGGHPAEIPVTIDPSLYDVAIVEGEQTNDLNALAGLWQCEGVQLFTLQNLAEKYPGLWADSQKVIRDKRKGLETLSHRKVADSTHSVNEYMALIRSIGFDSLIVGGATRDILLGKDIKDVDLATTAHALDVFNAITSNSNKLGSRYGAGQLSVRKNIAFHTVQVEATHEEGLDIISYHCHDKMDYSFSVTEDARFRDFTINAVYYAPFEKVIIDPVNGVDDLNKKIIRFIGDPEVILETDIVMIARWIKCVSKQGFVAAPGQGAELINRWLEYHIEKGIEEPMRLRFMDRMSCTPAEVIARSEKLGLNDTFIRKIISVHH